jgi:hypothetical protein
VLEDGSGVVSLNCFLIAPKNAFQTRNTTGRKKNKNIKM